MQGKFNTDLMASQERLLVHLQGKFREDVNSANVKLKFHFIHRIFRLWPWGFPFYWSLRSAWCFLSYRRNGHILKGLGKSWGRIIVFKPEKMIFSFGIHVVCVTIKKGTMWVKHNYDLLLGISQTTCFGLLGGHHQVSSGSYKRLCVVRCWDLIIYCHGVYQ